MIIIGGALGVCYDEPVIVILFFFFFFFVFSGVDWVCTEAKRSVHALKMLSDD